MPHPIAKASQGKAGEARAKRGEKERAVPVPGQGPNSPGLGNGGKLEFGVPFKPAIPNRCERKNKYQTVDKGVFHRFPSLYDDGFVYLLKK
jgi:hypothetical protein